MSNTYHISDRFRKNRYNGPEPEHDADIGFRYQPWRYVCGARYWALQGFHPHIHAANASHHAMSTQKRVMNVQKSHKLKESKTCTTHLEWRS